MLITKLSQTKRNNRVNLYLDEIYVTTVSIDTVARYRLYQGKDLSQTQLDEIVSEDLGKRLYFDALRQIQLRPRSTKEIRDYLQKRSIKYFTGPSDLWITKTLTLLLEQNYLNDNDFSHWWLENRQEFRGRSKLELYSELSKKGIDSKLIDEVLNAGQDEQDELKTIRASALKKFKLINLNDVKDPKQKQKVLAYFMRRGFRYESIKNALTDNIIF